MFWNKFKFGNIYFVKIYEGLQKKTDGYRIEDFVWSDGSPITFTAWYSLFYIFMSIQYNALHSQETSNILT
jgi:hypothetical protein